MSTINLQNKKTKHGYAKVFGGLYLCLGKTDAECKKAIKKIIERE